MDRLIWLLLFCQTSSPAKHSLTFHLLASSGVPNSPEFVAFANMEGAIIAYYDNRLQRPEPRQQWIQELVESEPRYWRTAVRACEDYQEVFLLEIDGLKSCLNQTHGAHVYQQSLGCGWDDERETTHGFNHYGHNGDDFLTLDLQTETWSAVDPQVEHCKQSLRRSWKYFLMNGCSDWLKRLLKTGQDLLQSTELPTVSLLQKTSSSPVSCLATGFYPDRASLMWRREGEELHEEVEHGELLPNHDGTFQLSVDLDLSSVAPEDWSRYDCVFQLAGVEEDKVTRLDKDAVQSNRAAESSDVTVPITAVALAAVLLAAAAAAGFAVYKRKQGARSPAGPENSSELSESLNPGARLSNPA